MAKKTLMTGIGIQMTSISTDSTFPLGKSYCVDVDKECADNTVSNLPVYEGGSTGTSKVTSGYATKKFLLTPEWLRQGIPEESLYFYKPLIYSTSTSWNGSTSYNVSVATYGYFPNPSDFSDMSGWDRFGKEVYLTYQDVQQPPLQILTESQDLLPGYRNQRYNFLFQANQYAYNLQWSLIDPPQGVILEPSGYFSLSEDGDKQVSYLLKVRVYNPDTEETATKEFTLVTAHPSYVPDSDLNDLRIEGPTYINIKPHRNFRQVWHAAGGMPPYTFSIDSPLNSQWPYRDSDTTSISFINNPSTNYGMRLDYTTNEIVVTDSPNASNPAPYLVGTPLFLEKVPFATDNPPANPPGNLSLNTDYFAVPQYNSSGNYTGRIKLAATRQEALDGGPTLSFGSDGSKTGRLVLPTVKSSSADGYRNGSVYYMTVNHYVQSLALSIALPPLPKHWGHGDRWSQPPLEDNPYLQPTGVVFPTNAPVGSQHTENGVTWQKTESGATSSQDKWIYVSGRRVWETEDANVLAAKTDKFLEYSTENKYLGQNLYALGFGDYTLTGSTTTPTRTQYPFDPWRFQNMANLATNYFDIRVTDGNGNTAKLRITVEAPDRDFSPSCGVPYWHAEMNYYKVNSRPFRNAPRTTGTVFEYNPATSEYTPIPYDLSKKTEYPHSSLSSTVSVLDNLDYYTYAMDVYYPASRFTEYSEVTTYGLKQENTYWPYEKLYLPLNKTPFYEMSIHPISMSYYGYTYDYWYWTGYYYGDSAFKFRKH